VRGRVSSQRKKNEPGRIVHPFDPYYDRESRILILGSFPSVKSREVMFFYGHPQNRFWKVIAAVFGEETPLDIPSKKDFLRRNHIAMWDSIHSCTITGSSDSSIRDVVPNDIGKILATADIRRIFCNGATSYRMYQKYICPVTGRDAVKLPSTSPANAAWSLDRLKEAWKVCAEAAEELPL
jgi:hypoxanthine-DNA glycosylase